MLYMEIFAERVKSLREENNLSMIALAKELKVSTASIYRWENCQAEIKADQLILLAKFFNVSTDYLLGLEN